MFRVHDGGVDRPRQGADRPLADVQFARPVAPLAPDGGRPGRERLVVAVDRPGHPVYAVDVAEQAPGDDGPPPAVAQVEARGKVPPGVRTEPADRTLPRLARFEAHVGPPAGARADGQVGPGDVIPEGLPTGPGRPDVVPDLAVRPLHPQLVSPGPGWIVRG